MHPQSSNTSCHHLIEQPVDPLKNLEKPDSKKETEYSKPGKGRNLAIIGASALQLPLIQKAKEMGYTTHVFAWKANDPGETAADFFYPISITEIEQITEICRTLDLAGICTIASDLAVITVNTAANALGLPANSPAATLLSTNKHQMRKCFEKHGDPSVQSILIRPGQKADLKNFSWPVIVKPTDRSGSRGITLVEDPAYLNEAIEAAMEVSFEKAALIEEYAKGQEYSVEVISWNGVHHMLAITRKETTGAPHFIETGHQEPSGLSLQKQNEVQEVVFHALNSLGLTQGASHTEIKIDDNGKIRIIEAAGRMGGDYIGSHLVHYSTGYDFVRMVIECAVGQPPAFLKDRNPVPVHSVYIVDEKSAALFSNRCKTVPESILEIPEPPESDFAGEITDSSSRFGCYIEKIT